MTLDRIEHDDSDRKSYTSTLTATTELDDVDYADYRFESARLNSFVKWHVPFIDPKKLAAAGFFYTEEEDAVKCFACQIILSGWMDGDDPKVEHQRWSGKCSFVRNMSCGNVPIGTDPSMYPKPKRMDTCGLYGCKFMPLSGPDDNLQIEKNPNNDIDITVFWDTETNTHSTAKLSDVLGSKQPTYASYERRLRSFETSTSDMICEKKEELAKAGFFYLSGLFGPSDQTMCFYCGKCLRSWEKKDDPVEEHVKWYPHCKFIKKVFAKRLEEKDDRAERTNNEFVSNTTTTVC
ncbi:PREDICTED: baculoviral IAP repeat-containing protein 7-A-like [Cyphomyrmex costatus]|uniref:Apoptosis 1 inhibitor n=1 Tax=Cyphomyrmex costatus TaxID=456900 RepID=A0A151INB1_9HYME|nr:PREDICTED: baculoviral IAP repeat-containing protein 7-A-like [Cyphomyrmex costatus]KYN06941.1 Apoptosis 1 inhibitor [Cyphomyrmex costatus]